MLLTPQLLLLLPLLGPRPPLQVRRDSLEIIDLWIDKCPALVRAHGSRLMDNFLRLVSSECRGGRGDMGLGSSWNTSKSLLENPNDQMASVDGRMSVFRRTLDVRRRFTGAAIQDFLPPLLW